MEGGRERKCSPNGGNGLSTGTEAYKHLVPTVREQILTMSHKGRKWGSPVP